MDLGIAGRKAIVVGASRGLGFACAKALAAEGVDVTIASRGGDAIADAAGRIAEATGAHVTHVAADTATDEGRSAILALCPRPDILVNNAGGPPALDFRQITRAQWSQALDTNFLSAVELINATLDGMIANGFGRIINITSLSVRMPLKHLDLSTAARMALTGYVAGVAREVAASGVTINNLLPGTFATERLLAMDRVTAEMVERVPMGRAGDPDEFGATCAFLCSRQAAYMTGQNVLLDGGICPFTV